MDTAQNLSLTIPRVHKVRQLSVLNDWPLDYIRRQKISRTGSNIGRPETLIE